MSDTLQMSLSWKPILSYNEKCQWEVSDKDIVELEGIKFVHLRLASLFLGFPRLVYHAAAASGIDLGDKHQWSLSSSSGYKLLQQMRNDAQSEELLSQLPEWQRPTAQVCKARQARKKKTIVKIDNRSSLCIQLPGVSNEQPRSVRIVRPVYHHEELWVEMNETVLHHVVQYLVSKPFDERSQRKRERDPEIPAGVHRRKVLTKAGGLTDQFIVRRPRGKQSRTKTVDGRGRPRGKPSRTKTVESFDVLLSGSSDDSNAGQAWL